MSKKLNRRIFLKTALKTGSVAWLVGGSGKALRNVFANPVPFLQAPSCTPTGPDVPSADRTYFQINPALEPSLVFTHSVAAGDPRPSGVVLWTRVDPDKGYLNLAAPVAYQISEAADFSTLMIEGLACIDSSKDYTVKLPIAHSALAALSTTGVWKTYYYRFIHNGCVSKVGRFKTLPASTEALAGLKFGFVSCQNYKNYYTALQHMAKESVDFVVHLGDYIYEKISTDGARAIPPMPVGATVAQDLMDFRHLYKVYKSDPDLQAAHEKFAFIQIWDDHEFSDNSYKQFSKMGADLSNLRRAANQAWSEYCLADVAYNPDPAVGPLDSIKVYRSLPFGTLAEFVITDERMYRDGPVCGTNTTMTSRCAAASDANRTMLGVEQKAWFIDTVKRSKATWKIWVNEVMLMQMKSLGVYVNLDQWDGYPAERKDILTKLSTTTVGAGGVSLPAVKNLIAVTGDIHSFIAGYLKPDFASSTSPKVAVEFVTGSITSGNMAENGSGFLAGSMVSNNSGHMIFFNSSTHGYSIMELKATEAVCTMKSVSTVRSTTATLSTLKSFKVPKDQVSITMF